MTLPGRPTGKGSRSYRWTSRTSPNFCNLHSSDADNFYDLFSFKDSIPAEKAVVPLQEFAESGLGAVMFSGSGKCTIRPG
jgi:hypothetical protein